MKILISWEAFNNDYDQNGNPSPNGPNSSFHQAFFVSEKFDKHILLSARDNDRPIVQKLHGYLRNTFEGRDIELQVLAIKDIINVNEIKGVVLSFLKPLQRYELYFFVSPGTPAMQVVWYLLHIELNGWKTQLIQTRRASDTARKKADLIYIEVEKSSVPTSLIQKEIIQKRGFIGTTKEIHLGASLKPVYNNAMKVAQANGIHVLLQGPTGAGKEHLARFIHDQSARRSTEMLTVNCSAFTDELLLSELFGHSKGAFTGATEKKIGLLVKANKGTVFLDEIGDISPFAQQALLRVLQNGEVRALGSNEVTKIDVRVITATHRNLKDMCSQDKFRWDLYYRLSTAKLNLPSLQDGGEKEKGEYLDFFIDRVQHELKKPTKLQLADKVRNYLLSYSYPGNLREMQNIVSTLYVFYDNQAVNDFTYLSDLDQSETATTSLKYAEAERPFMKKHIERVLKETNGNISKAAKAIGWAQNTLRSNADQVGIDIDAFRS